MEPTDDTLDGCELDFSEAPTRDSETDMVALFADVDPSDDEAVERRSAEWAEMFR